MRKIMVSWRVIEHIQAGETWYTAQTKVRRWWRTVRRWNEGGSSVRTTSSLIEAEKWARECAGLRLPIESRTVTSGCEFWVVEPKEGKR